MTLGRLKKHVSLGGFHKADIPHQSECKGEEKEWQSPSENKDNKLDRCSKRKEISIPVFAMKKKEVASSPEPT